MAIPFRRYYSIFAYKFIYKIFTGKSIPELESYTQKKYHGKEKSLPEKYYLAVNPAGMVPKIKDRSNPKAASDQKDDVVSKMKLLNKTFWDAKLDE